MNDSAEATALKGFIREHSPGKCKMFSKGEECQCPLCLVDNMTAREFELQHELNVLQTKYNALVNACRAVQREEDENSQ